MYVRLAFAVAAHLEPEILVVDEVLAVGDAEFQKKCLGKMEEASRSEGRTVLFVSHNMVAAQSLCQRALMISEGVLVADSSSATVVTRYHELVHCKSKEIARIFQHPGSPIAGLVAGIFLTKRPQILTLVHAFVQSFIVEGTQRDNR